MYLITCFLSNQLQLYLLCFSMNCNQSSIYAASFKKSLILDTCSGYTACNFQCYMCDRSFAMDCRCHWLTMIPYETVYQSTVIGSAVYLLNQNAVCLCQFLRHQMNMYQPCWIIYTMFSYHVSMAVSAHFLYYYRLYYISDVFHTVWSFSVCKNNVVKVSYPTSCGTCRITDFDNIIFLFILDNIWVGTLEAVPRSGFSEFFQLYWQWMDGWMYDLHSFR